MNTGEGEEVCKMEGRREEKRDEGREGGREGYKLILKNKEGVEMPGNLVFQDAQITICTTITDGSHTSH